MSIYYIYEVNYKQTCTRTPTTKQQQDICHIKRQYPTVY